MSYASNSAFKQTSMEEQFGKLASQQFRSQWRGFASGGRSLKTRLLPPQRHFSTFILPLNDINASDTFCTSLTSESLLATGGHHGEGITHAGLTLHKPASWHVATGKALAGLMWYVYLYVIRLKSMHLKSLPPPFEYSYHYCLLLSGTDRIECARLHKFSFLVYVYEGSGFCTASTMTTILSW